MNAVSIAAIWEALEAGFGIVVLLILAGDWIADHLARKGKP